MAWSASDEAAKRRKMGREVDASPVLARRLDASMARRAWAVFKLRDVVGSGLSRVLTHEVRGAP